MYSAFMPLDDSGPTITTVATGPVGDAQRHGRRWGVPPSRPFHAPPRGSSWALGAASSGARIDGTVDSKGPSMHQPCEVKPALRCRGRWAAPLLAGPYTLEGSTVGRSNPPCGSQGTKTTHAHYCPCHWILAHLKPLSGLSGQPRVEPVAVVRLQGTWAMRVSEGILSPI